jgi:2-keto-4-pentenoate hydratase/2-oxohepta-3-ene-1,7-dioic acid hydratase in catechol pathway
VKIARVIHAGRVSTAVVETGDRGDDTILLSPDVTVLDLLAADPGARAELVERHGDQRVALADVTLRSPVHPGALRDFVSFERHVEGMEKPRGHDTAPAPWFEHPTMIFMNPHSAIGTGELVEPPPDARVMDFELEVAAVIGRDCRNITSEQATEHIAGYAVCNDWSARDIQGRDMRMGLGPSKGKDFATTIGPWIVTTDELEPYRQGDRFDLDMSVSINGVEFGRDRLSHMAWSFEELVSYSARAAWVRAGDVLMSGTCSGGALAEGWGRTGTQEPPPLQTGDLVAMTVEHIGTIENQLAAPVAEVAPIPPATRLFD